MSIVDNLPSYTTTRINPDTGLNEVITTTDMNFYFVNGRNRFSCYYWLNNNIEYFDVLISGNKNIYEINNELKQTQFTNGLHYVKNNDQTILIYPYTFGYNTEYDIVMLKFNVPPDGYICASHDNWVNNLMNNNLKGMTFDFSTLEIAAAFGFVERMYHYNVKNNYNINPFYSSIENYVQIYYGITDVVSDELPDIGTVRINPTTNLIENMIITNDNAYFSHQQVVNINYPLNIEYVFYDDVKKYIYVEFPYGYYNIYLLNEFLKKSQIENNVCYVNKTNNTILFYPYSFGYNSNSGTILFNINIPDETLWEWPKNTTNGWIYQFMKPPDEDNAGSMELSILNIKLNNFYFNSNKLINQHYVVGTTQFRSLQTLSKKTHKFHIYYKPFYTLPKFYSKRKNSKTMTSVSTSMKTLPLKQNRKELVLPNDPENCFEEIKKVNEDGTITTEYFAPNDDINDILLKKNNCVVTTECFNNQNNTLKRVRRTTNIVKKYDTTNTPTMFTNTNDYLASRNKSIEQNKFNYLRAGDATVKPGSLQAIYNIYSTKQNLIFKKIIGEENVFVASNNTQFDNYDNLIIKWRFCTNLNINFVISNKNVDEFVKDMNNQINNANIYCVNNKLETYYYLSFNTVRNNSRAFQIKFNVITGKEGFKCKNNNLFYTLALIDSQSNRSYNQMIEFNDNFFNLTDLTSKKIFYDTMFYKFNFVWNLFNQTILIPVTIVENITLQSFVDNLNNYIINNGYYYTYIGQNNNNNEDYYPLLFGVDNIQQKIKIIFKKLMENNTNGYSFKNTILKDKITQNNNYYVNGQILDFKNNVRTYSTINNITTINISGIINISSQLGFVSTDYLDNRVTNDNNADIEHTATNNFNANSFFPEKDTYEITLKHDYHCVIEWNLFQFTINLNFENKTQTIQAVVDVLNNQIVNSEHYYYNPNNNNEKYYPLWFSVTNDKIVFTFQSIQHVPNNYILKRTGEKYMNTYICDKTGQRLHFVNDCNELLGFVIDVYFYEDDVFYESNSLVYYKPKNYKFAQQGAVIMSNLVDQNKIDLINTIAATYTEPYGEETATMLSYKSTETNKSTKDKIGYSSVETPVISPFDGSVKSQRYVRVRR